MLRRWVIRSVFLLPVLLCVAGWGWSGTHEASFVYMSDSGRIFGCRILSGVVCIQTGESAPFYTGIDWGPGLHWRVGPQNPGRFWPAVKRTLPFEYWRCFLGFRVWDHYFFGGHWHEVGIPFYVPILIGSGFLVIVWRKSRTRTDPRTAFPVEVKGRIAPTPPEGGTPNTVT